MTILALDPGPEKTAWCLYADGKPQRFGHTDNHNIIQLIRRHTKEESNPVAIEIIEGFGLRVGMEVFSTCEWIGRFTQVLADSDDFMQPIRVPRRAVKLALCQNPQARDTDVRAAVLHRYGGKSAIGTKKNPGVLYGITGDMWSALAVGIVASETAASAAGSERGEA